MNCEDYYDCINNISSWLMFLKDTRYELAPADAVVTTVY